MAIANTSNQVPHKIPPDNPWPARTIVPQTGASEGEAQLATAFAVAVIVSNVDGRSDQFG
jgi:hypothetical protein